MCPRVLCRSSEPKYFSLLPIYQADIHLPRALYMSSVQNSFYYRNRTSVNCNERTDIQTFNSLAYSKF